MANGATQIVPLHTARGERLELLLPDSAPSWFPAAVDDFRRLLQLPENWDTYGAAPIAAEAVAAAAALLLRTASGDTPKPSVVPTVDGGVQLEWHRHGIDLEVEIRPTGEYSAFYEDRVRGTEWETTVGAGEPRIRTALAELTRRAQAASVAP